VTIVYLGLRERMCKIAQRGVSLLYCSAGRYYCDNQIKQDGMGETYRTHSIEHTCVHVITIDRTMLRCFTGIIIDFRDKFCRRLFVLQVRA